MKDFRNLKVWEKAHRIALDCYRITTNFPRNEVFGLTSQIRRAGSSIGANIAEGCGRGSNADFQRFLHVAMGSGSELEYHLLLSRDLGYLEGPDYDLVNERIIELKRMMASLIRKIDAERRP